MTEEEKEFTDIEEVDETTPEVPTQEEIDEEVERLKKKIAEFEQLDKVSGGGAKFGRVESKPEFASEVINTPTNQKVANLEVWEIGDLLNKRRFMNFCNAYKWDVVGELAHKTIKDVENYSLSKDGFLIRHALIEQQKQALYSYENKKYKGVKDYNV